MKARDAEEMELAAGHALMCKADSLVNPLLQYLERETNHDARLGIAVMSIAIGHIIGSMIKSRDLLDETVSAARTIAQSEAEKSYKRHQAQ